MNNITNSLLLVFLAIVFVACARVPNITAVINEKQTSRETINPSAKILTYGLYNVTKKGNLVSDPTSTTGKIINKPIIELVKQTNRIPMKLGHALAYQYRVSEIPKELLRLPLRRVLLHPEMLKPDGTTSTSSERVIHKPIKRGEVFALDGYTFNEEYEMVEGEWIFQLWYENNILIEQKFTSYWPN